MKLALVALVLVFDAGTINPVVLDVNHGVVFENLRDGGVSDVPRYVDGGVWADDSTTIWLAEKKADARGKESVGPEIDVKTLTVVGAVMFGIGVLVGGAVVAVIKR